MGHAGVEFSLSVMATLVVQVAVAAHVVPWSKMYPHLPTMEPGTILVVLVLIWVGRCRFGQINVRVSSLYCSKGILEINSKLQAQQPLVMLVLEMFVCLNVCVFFSS